MKVPKTVLYIAGAALILLLFDRHDFAGEGTDNAELVSNAVADTSETPAETGILQAGPETVTDDLYKSRRNAITTAVEKVSPAIVGISTKGVQRYRQSFTNDPWFKQFIPDRVYEQEVSGLGSGFIISQDGYVVTNEHVVENASEVTVTMTDGRKFSAEIVNRDYFSDLALLKIDGTGFPHVNLGNSDDIIIGEWVVALGNPFGLFEVNDQPSVTVGVVSATGRDFGKYINDRYYNDMIQTDASINPGNSGGPLVNSAGQVIGVNSFILTGGKRESGSVGLGFAIPINKVIDVVNELKERAGEDSSYYTGLRIYKYPINRQIQYQLGLRTREGALIVEIDADSPADKVGLEAGDIIIGADEYQIRNPQDINTYLQRLNPRPGDVVKLKILRGRTVYDANLTIEQKPGQN